MYERSEHDHGAAERPKDGQQRQAIIEVELPAKAARDDELKEDQPEPASPQESAQLRDCLPAKRQKCTSAGKQEEYRRTKVRYPASEEHRCRGSGEVCRIDARRTDELPNMIQRHDDHDYTAQDIARPDSEPIGSRCRVPTGRARCSLISQGMLARRLRY